jgi:hypothetical protein
LATTWRNAGAPRNLGDAGHWTPIPLVTCILADQLLLVRGISADDLNSKSIMQSHPHSIELLVAISPVETAAVWQMRSARRAWTASLATFRPAREARWASASIAR